MSDPRRSLGLTTWLWWLAGVAVAVALWDGAPDPGPPMVGSMADAQWPPEQAGVVQRPRHSPFP